MSTTSHQPAGTAVETGRREHRVPLRGMWPALAIAVIWLAVLFAAVSGHDIVTINPGGNVSHVPSAIVVALFAWPATWAVAKYGFGRRDDAD